jgi:Nif-specific regulatory protein
VARYEVVSVLAEGGQGRVYRASDRITGQRCVLKTGNSARDEAVLALQLNHPYIAKPFDAGVDPSLRQYAAYPEYTETPILEWTKNSNKSDLQRVALQIAEVLAFIHRRGWLYHDFKPQHFLVGSNSIRVLDLGLAQKITETSNTFSGTFPYIAPERLTGRKCDARSDIFALGMVLLHVLLPNENWEFEPSIEVLQNLQKQTDQLPSFWKNLLREMICLEPTQRIDSAAELWQRLLPKHARNNLLFFPIPPYFDIPSNFLQTKQVTIFQTASSLNILEIERVVLQQAWHQNFLTATFDFRNTSPEEVFSTLALAQLNQKPKELFSAIECLQKAEQLKPHTIVLRHPESLNASQRARLSYTLSSLQDIASLRFVLLGRKQAVELPDNSAQLFEIPTLSKKQLSQCLDSAFPMETSTPNSTEKIRTGSYSLPDQIFVDLQKQLSPELFSIWPAASRDCISLSFEKLTFNELRILGCLAIASAPLRTEWVTKSLNLLDPIGIETIENLQAKGFVQQQNGDTYLVPNRKDVLKRFRKDRVLRFTQALLKIIPKNESPEVLYNIARISRNNRTAALQALRVARSKRNDSETSANEWFWNGFIAGAKLPKLVLFKLADFTLRSTQHKAAKRILQSIRSRFGVSFTLARSWIDFYWRASDFKSVEKLSLRSIRIARTKQNSFQVAYFQTWQAGSLIMQSRYNEASEILNNLVNHPDLKIRKRIKGQTEHYRGLNAYFKGETAKAIQHTYNAATSRHPKRGVSIMNLGIFYLQRWNIEKAEKWLLRAIRYFQRANDSVGLSYLLNNIGVFFKRTGRINEAQNYFFQSLQLSRIFRNQNLTLSCLTNLSETYEIEGRLSKALQLLTRSMRLAERENLIRQKTYILNQKGRLCGILGQYRQALVHLRKAARLCCELDIRVELGISFELMGLVYFFLKHPQKAMAQFSKALKLYEQASLSLECKRIKLFCALTTDDLCLVQEIGKGLSGPSLENGLYHYFAAMLLLKFDSQNDFAIRGHMREAEKILRNVPALFWVGRVLALKGQYYLVRDHVERARIALESAYNIFSRLGAKKEILNLNRVYMDMKDHSDLLNRMSERLPFKVLLMVKEVLTERNAERMIERILSTSIEFTDMERAALILLDTPPRIFKSATLDNNFVQEVLEISQSALEEAAEAKKSYVRLDTLSDAYLKGKPSIVANRIRSILCLPLSSGEKPTGVLYLDSKEGIESVAKTESVLLEIFANIISLVLEDAVELEESKNQNEILKRSIHSNGHFPGMVGNSKGIGEVRENILRLAEGDHTVLIVGETGTGKELVARLLHNSSKRKDALFIPVNCASITETLLESELFGHEKGAFTGADSTKKGLFELAENGTLFLDEIADLPYLVQAKLLRVLQEREFRRVGGNTLLHTNARVILASNKDLLQMVKEKKFREDLYYRVSGIQIHVPTLRSRKEDIALLANQFLKSANAQRKLKLHGFTRDAINLIESYSWPGNVRQLKNEIERISALSQNEWIEPEDFSKEIQNSTYSNNGNETLRDIEQGLILQRLNQFQWNIVQTSKSLGMTRHGLYNKMRTYNIKRISASRKQRSSK